MTPDQRFKASASLCQFWAGSEWYSFALEGLWIACKTYDSARGPFHQWAKLKIESLVLDAQRAAKPVPRRAFGRGVRNAGELLEWMKAESAPSPEECVLIKEQVLAVRRRVMVTEGNEGALLRASLLEQEHQEVAERRGLSKSWMSRINSKAEKRLARQLWEHRPEGLRKTA